MKETAEIRRLPQKHTQTPGNVRMCIDLLVTLNYYFKINFHHSFLIQWKQNHQNIIICTG